MSLKISILLEQTGAGKDHRNAAYLRQQEFVVSRKCSDSGSRPQYQKFTQILNIYYVCDVWRHLVLSVTRKQRFEFADTYLETGFRLTKKIYGTETYYV